MTAHRFKPPPVVAVVVALVATLVFLAGCAGQSTTVSEPSAAVRLVSVDEAADIHNSRTADLVVLDVRTPEEFAAGHLDDAVMIDFYAEDFADQLAELDPEASYLLYCRSGNRSGQASALMQDLGFSDVADVDGGIVAWGDAGYTLTTP